MAAEAKGKTKASEGNGGTIQKDIEKAVLAITLRMSRQQDQPEAIGTSLREQFDRLAKAGYRANQIINFGQHLVDVTARLSFAAREMANTKVMSAADEVAGRLYDADEKAKIRARVPKGTS